MEIERELNINVRRTVEKSVNGRDDFHFYVDELTSKDYMPTYAGLADEKYAFDEMNDEFFEFISKKIKGDGIYIRLVLACGIDSYGGEAVFDLEYGDKSETFRTRDLDNVLAFEFADFGVKVKNGTVTFGATVDGGCGHTPFFAEFGSAKANEEYLSLKNPLNQRVMEIMENFLVLDE